MTITKDQFKEYATDVLGYSPMQVDDIFDDMKTFGTPLQDILEAEQISECVAYTTNI